ncbi:MAG: translation initiation factor [Clostridiales bacterium]|nr:translation initiation factor [Clostridiales bacterium]
MLSYKSKTKKKSSTSHLVNLFIKVNSKSIYLALTMFISGLIPSIHFLLCYPTHEDRTSCYILIRRCSVISKNELMINEEIRDKEVRLIDADGSMLGVMPIKEAQKVASLKNLDLVKIAPQAAPPVCRVMDYGKYMFELAKKEKEARKNQKIISLKEVRLSPSIEDHDFETKLKNAYKFLKDGDKVKVSVKFRGREMNHTSLGSEVLEKFAEGIKDVGVVEKRPKLEGKNMIMFVNPKQ